MSIAAAIIRLCYPPGTDEHERAWRFELFRHRVIRRIQAQVVPTDVWVWTHPRHEDEIRAMDPAIHTFTVDLEAGSVRFDATSLRGYPWAAVRGLPRYPLQVLLGSDDLLGPHFVARAMAELGKIKPPRAIVSFQPTMLDTSSGRLYQMPVWPRPSPMLVLRQPIDDPRYTWVWAEDHRKLGRMVDRVAYVEEGHAVMLVHGYNDGTGLRSNQRELDRSAIPWLAE